MLSSNHWLPGIDPVIGAFTLSIWAAGALAVALICVGVVAFRRAGQPGTAGIVWRSALAVVGALLVWTMISPSLVREQVAARRLLDVRAADLTARVIASGSPLACLDVVGNAVVEAACERTLFASPEAVAAAVAYIDVRLALLADNLALTGDPGTEPALERMRRAVEADRYGVVAHVLTTRGCNVSDCAGLKLLRDPNRVLANLKGRTFDQMVARHSTTWRRDGAAIPPTPPIQPMAAGSPSVSMDSAEMPAGSSVPALASTTGASAPAVRYDYPSAASIPPVNIMNVEPTAPPEPSAAASPSAPARQQMPAVRRQTTREPPPATATTSPYLTPQPPPGSAPVVR
jgi:hypothetical protein